MKLTPEQKHEQAMRELNAAREVSRKLFNRVLAAINGDCQIEHGNAAFRVLELVRMEEGQ